MRGRTGDFAFGTRGVTVEAVVACVECVLVVGRQRSQGDIPPGRVCLKREDHTLAQNARPRGAEEAVPLEYSSIHHAPVAFDSRPNFFPSGRL